MELAPCYLVKLIKIDTGTKRKVSLYLSSQLNQNMCLHKSFCGVIKSNTIPQATPKRHIISFKSDFMAFVEYLLISTIYKAEKPSVRPHFCCHAANSVSSAWINSGLGLCESHGHWHEQVCFYKFLRPVCYQECLKDATVVHFEFHFASRKFTKLCNFAPS